METLQLVESIEHLLDEKKGLEITHLDLQGRSPFTDFFIIATGTSDRHLRALAQAVDIHASANRIPVLGVEGMEGEVRWILIDLADVIVHLFTEEARGFYDLEKLWSGEMPAMEARRNMLEELAGREWAVSREDEEEQDSGTAVPERDEEDEEDGSLAEASVHGIPQERVEG